MRNNLSEHKLTKSAKRGLRFFSFDYSYIGESALLEPHEGGPGVRSESEHANEQGDGGRVRND